MLKDAGYATGIFGKWHLGDQEPYRPDKRGFDEVYIHGAGGIGQNYPHSADFPNNDYNNPVLYHNGKVIETKGFCTDLYFDQAILWIGKQQKAKKPFFCYIPPNVNHGPHIPPILPDGSKGDSLINLDGAGEVGGFVTVTRAQSLVLRVALRWVHRDAEAAESAHPRAEPLLNF